MKTEDLSDSTKLFHVTGSDWNEVLTRGLEYVRDNAVAPSSAENSAAEITYRLLTRSREYFLRVEIEQHLPES